MIRITNVKISIISALVTLIITIVLQKYIKEYSNILLYISILIIVIPNLTFKGKEK